MKSRLIPLAISSALFITLICGRATAQSVYDLGSEAGARQQRAQQNSGTTYSSGSSGSYARKQKRKDKKRYEARKAHELTLLQPMIADIENGIYHPEDPYRLNADGNVTRFGEVINQKPITVPKAQYCAELNSVVRKNNARARERGWTVRPDGTFDKTPKGTPTPN